MEIARFLGQEFHEIHRLLIVIPQDTPEGARNHAIMLTFLDTGVRLSELVNLKIPDIDFVGGQFKVFGMGAKERIVPMGLATRRAIIRYKDHFRPPVNPTEERLFLSVSGEPISKDSVEKVVQRLARRAQIPHSPASSCSVGRLTLVIRNEAVASIRLGATASVARPRRLVQ